MVLAVCHEAYLNLDPDGVVKAVGHPLAVVACFGILDDKKIVRGAWLRGERTRKRTY